MLGKYLPNNPITYLQPVIRDAFLLLFTKSDKENFSLPPQPAPLPNSVTEMRTS